MVIEVTEHHSLKLVLLLEKFTYRAYAQQLGASGSTFFDDAVTEFFSPHAKDKSTMIVVGLGIPGYKARRGKVLAEDYLRISFNGRNFVIHI